ncbi:HAL protein kinase [Fusarium oxysporum f. sp. albedinis]|nr:HAL protein kinase [Fusarium oxysporum f. sp. albedinis]
MMETGFERSGIVCQTLRVLGPLTQIRVFILCYLQNLPLEDSTFRCVILTYPCLHVTSQHLFNSFGNECHLLARRKGSTLAECRPPACPVVVMNFESPTNISRSHFNIKLSITALSLPNLEPQHKAANRLIT